MDESPTDLLTREEIEDILGFEILDRQWKMIVRLMKEKEKDK